MKPHRVDVQTVRSFHVLMPMNSSGDNSAICQMIHDFEAFPRVRSPSVRRKLEYRVLGCERILTLRSFHADMILLEACYRPLRDIFPMKGMSLRKACEASFRLDMQYLEANYIDLWLHTMRNQDPANLKKDGRKDARISRLDSEMKDVELASFAASRGFWSYKIRKLLTQTSIQIPSPRTSANSPQLSCDEVDIPIDNRCSRPRRSDHEQGWKNLSLENVFQVRTASTKQYPTPFAVARHVIWSFWGSHVPEGWDHSERIVQRAQYLQYINAPDHTENGGQASSSQSGCADDTDPMEGIFQDPASSPRPASSIYVDSSRSPSAPTSPRYRSTGDGKVWSEENLIDSYQHPYADNPSHQYLLEKHTVGSSGQDGTLQATDLHEDALTAHKPTANSRPPTPTGSETLSYPMQAGESHIQQMQVEADEIWQAPSGRKQTQDRLRRADENSYQIQKKSGHREIQHRVEKPQHGIQKRKAKQKLKKLLTALQDHEDAARRAASQKEFVVRSEYEQTETEDIHIEEVDRHNASQSSGGADGSNALHAYRPLLSQEHLSDDELSATSSSALATP